MQITRTADYALRAVVYLADCGPGACAPAARIAREQEIPPDYVPKVLQALSRAGIISSARGRGGGASLRQDPRRISVLDIVEAVDGPVALNRCVTETGQCSREGTCSVHDFWSKTQAALTQMLSGAKVSQFCRRHGKPPAGDKDTRKR